ncbi:MAG: TetR/AcrR family transcriptional regulator [Deltaproteobacteria bacterium]|nr:TetR/AcrR family transcriptional regulator [Deltaproteobacteria bacterium]
MNVRADQKSKTRASILASSARLLRERGIVGARVADVMEGAGLTVGGFYAHWPSKEALVDETITTTACAMREHLFHRLDDKPEEARAEVVVKRYLSVANRDQIALGCPFPAIAGEIATTAPAHAPVLAEQIEALTDGMRPLVPDRPGITSRQLALGLAALMIGGLTLARATRGTPLSDQVLTSSRALARVVLGR